jgi:imidazolonepropionase-like amidohydrolase
MPIAARQLLMSGITTARDLGAPLEDILDVKRRIDKGEIPGPRMFVSGPFIQKAPYFEYEKFVRWGVESPEDARAKVQRLVDAGVDVIKLIDQDQLTDDEVAAVVQTAHKGGKPVVAHAHREDEIRMGLKHGVDCFEHTGLATEPGLSRRRPRGDPQAQQHALLVPDDRRALPGRLHRAHVPRAPGRSRLARGRAEGHRGRHPRLAAQRPPRSTTSR